MDGRLTVHLSLQGQQNVVDCSLSRGLTLQKFHEHSSTTFWVILSTVWKRPLSMLEKLILYPGSDPDQSQNLINSSWAIPHLHIKFHVVLNFLSNLVHKQTDRYHPSFAILHPWTVLRRPWRRFCLLLSNCRPTVFKVFDCYMRHCLFSNSRVWHLCISHKLCHTRYPWTNFKDDLCSEVEMLYWIGKFSVSSWSIGVLSRADVDRMLSWVSRVYSTYNRSFRRRVRKIGR